MKAIAITALFALLTGCYMPQFEARRDPADAEHRHEGPASTDAHERAPRFRTIWNQGTESDLVIEGRRSLVKIPYDGDARYLTLTLDGESHELPVANGFAEGILPAEAVRSGYMSISNGIQSEGVYMEMRPPIDVRVRLMTVELCGNEPDWESAKALVEKQMMTHLPISSLMIEPFELKLSPIEQTEDGYIDLPSMSQAVLDIHSLTDGEKGVFTIGITGRCPGVGGVAVRGGGWASLSRIDTPDSVVHEIGHNLGFSHVACNGVEERLDDGYPYPEGELGGVPGFNVMTDERVDTTNHRSHMSYCNNEWTSDYHWDELVVKLGAKYGPGGQDSSGADAVGCSH